MGKPLLALVRRVFFSGKGNLVSWDDPYAEMSRLLAGREVTAVIDAGASDGRITRRLLRLFPRATAYLFEPHPDYAEPLRQFAQDDPRVKPQLCALSDRCGAAELHLTQRRGQTSLFKPSQLNQQIYAGSTTATQTLEVPATTLDDWSAQAQHPPIQLVKFDIQASESRAIRGGRRLLTESVLLIYCEVYFNPMYEGGASFGDIDALLRGYGFLLYNLYKPRADRRGLLLFANAIYVHPDKLGM